MKFLKRLFRKNKLTEPTREELADVALKFILNELKMLSEPYDIQYEAMEDFARWNLPEETGLTWTDEFELFFTASNIEFLNISEETVSLIQKIRKNFDDAFELEQDEYNVIWSHESMKNHPFWENQRDLAKQVLILLEKQFSQDTTD